MEHHCISSHSDGQIMNVDASSQVVSNISTMALWAAPWDISNLSDSSLKLFWFDKYHKNIITFLMSTFCGLIISSLSKKKWN
ncbi:unnamed protein product [Arctogadus glacialis]